MGGVGGSSTPQMSQLSPTKGEGKKGKREGKGEKREEEEGEGVDVLPKNTIP